MIEDVQWKIQYEDNIKVMKMYISGSLTVDTDVD